MEGDRTNPFATVDDQELNEYASRVAATAQLCQRGAEAEWRDPHQLYAAVGRVLQLYVSQDEIERIRRTETPLDPTVLLERREQWLATDLKDWSPEGDPRELNLIRTLLLRKGIFTVGHLVMLGRKEVRLIYGIGDGVRLHLIENGLQNNLGVVWEEAPSTADIKAMFLRLSDITVALLPGVRLDSQHYRVSMQDMLDVSPDRRGRFLNRYSYRTQARLASREDRKRAQDDLDLLNHKLAKFMAAWGALPNG